MSQRLQHHMLTDVIKKFHLLVELGNAEDFADNLNYRYTGVFLLLCMSVRSLQQFVFKQIQCWVPQEWPETWEQYAENYCWVEDTYFVDGNMKSEFPRGNRHQLEIAYYQWVPFLFACQAACFFAPHLLWRCLSRLSSYDANALIHYALSASALDQETRSKVVQRVGQMIVKSMGHNETYKKVGGIKRFIPCVWIGKKSGNFLVTQYLITKILYIINALCQFWFMRDYLGFGSFFFGFNILVSLAQCGTWAENAMFPRVTFCDVSIRAVGQYYNRTIQCVLPTNMINEKIYIFLWFWILYALVSMVISFCWWTSTLAIRTRTMLLNRYVGDITIGTKEEKKKFIKGFLGRDGLFLVKMIKRACGDVIGTEVLEQAFIYWKKREAKKEEEDKSEDLGIFNSE